ncbi:MAG: DUF86 domain-containing protein [bacterium]|nr:DUF86 domain-containing protein [bacterium]
MYVRPSSNDRLLHILEAIDRIMRFQENLTYEAFSENEMAQFAIIKNFEIIGEAAYQLPEEVRASNRIIEWRKVIAFRHILVHDYYKVNTRIVWNAIESKLPDMKLEIVQMLEEE